MPRIWYEQGFRFSFYSADGDEPPHVHVSKENKRAKWWLEAIHEARNSGFTRAERATIRAIIRDRRATFLEKWHDFFGDQS